MWEELSNVVVSLLPQLVQCLDREELRVLALSLIDVIFRHMPDPSPLAAYFHTNSVFAKLMQLLSTSFVLSPQSSEEGAGKKPVPGGKKHGKKKKATSATSSSGDPMSVGGEDPMTLDSTAAWLASFEGPPSLDDFSEKSKSTSSLLGGSSGLNGKPKHGSGSGGKTSAQQRKEQEEAEKEAENKLKTAEVLCHLFLQMSKHPRFAEALAVAGLMHLLSNDSLPAFREMQSPYTQKVNLHLPIIGINI